jgi:hypothetical protein
MFEKEHIQITASGVVKSGPPQDMRIEVEKTRRAVEIGRASGLFRVPEVLEFDEGRGLAVFERIKGIEPLRKHPLHGRQGGALAERIGRAFAAIHRDLVLPPDMTLPLPPEFSAEGQDVFLHGDPSVENIFVDMGDGSLVILDWQMTDVHGGQATYGCRYFDLLWFVNNLIWTPTWRNLWSDPERPISRRFVESYYQATGLPFDRTGFGEYAERFFAVKLPLRGRGSRRERLYIPRGRYLSRRFIRAVEEDYFHD